MSKAPVKSRKSKNKKNKNKKVLVTILVIILAILLVAFALNVGKKDNDKDKTKKKVVDEIKHFSYSVSESDTKLFKDTFKELKTELSKKEVDNKKYAELISKLFVIDFYTLDNKNSKNDVGGVQFIYEKHKTDFIDKAREGIYKQVKSNLDNDRSQKLPKVSSVNVTSVEEIVPSTVFEHEDFKNVQEANSYEISIKWAYENNDNFQKEATIVVVPDGEKLSIAKLD